MKLERELGSEVTTRERASAEPDPERTKPTVASLWQTALRQAEGDREKAKEIHNGLMRQHGYLGEAD